VSDDARTPPGAGQPSAPVAGPSGKPGEVAPASRTLRQGEAPKPVGPIVWDDDDEGPTLVRPRQGEAPKPVGPIVWDDDDEGPTLVRPFALPAAESEFVVRKKYDDVVDAVEEDARWLAQKERELAYARADKTLPPDKLLSAQEYYDNAVLMNQHMQRQLQDAKAMMARAGLVPRASRPHATVRTVEMIAADDRVAAARNDLAVATIHAEYVHHRREPTVAGVRQNRKAYTHALLCDSALAAAMAEAEAVRRVAQLDAEYVRLLESPDVKLRERAYNDLQEAKKKLNAAVENTTRLASEVADSKRAMAEPKAPNG